MPGNGRPRRSCSDERSFSNAAPSSSELSDAASAGESVTASGQLKAAGRSSMPVASPFAPSRCRPLNGLASGSAFRPPCSFLAMKTKAAARARNTNHGKPGTTAKPHNRQAAR